MTTRSIRSTVTFASPFSLPGYAGDLPAGAYEVLAEEELIHGLSFTAYRRTATYLTVSRSGRTEWRATSDADLQAALSRDAATSETNNHSEAALLPLEDLK